MRLSDFRGTHIKEKTHDEDFVRSYHRGDSHLVLLCVGTGQCPGGGTPPQPVSQSFVLDAGAVFGECAFPVQFDLKGKASQITLPGGRFIITAPQQHVTLTNLTPGATKTVTLNITGASHQSTNSNGDVTTVVTGRNLLGDPDAGFVLAIGSFSFTFDKNSNLIQPLAGTGQLIKVCPLIS